MTSYPGLPALLGMLQNVNSSHGKEGGEEFIVGDGGVEGGEAGRATMKVAYSSS